jgi:predicted dehydrogenase
MIIHWIDAARYLLGEIDSVYARLHRVNPAIAGEDVAQLLIGHVGGATSLMDHSWGTAPERPEHGRREGNLLLEGRDGSFRFDDGPGQLVRLGLDGSQQIVGSYKEGDEPFLAAFAACIGHFAGCLRRHQAFESEIDDNLATLRATLAAYESAADNRVIRLAAPGEAGL